MTESFSALPRHLAVIMDGNGRWAQKRGLPRAEGHRAGAQAVRSLVTECRKRGIQIVTLYAFSSENWNRPKMEIAALFNLLLEFLTVETPLMREQDIKLNVLGDLEGLPLPQRAALKLSMEKTCACSHMILNLALNYGARSEIVRAVREMLKKNIDPDSLTAADFAKYLYTKDQPDPDLVIRTSGEQRLSNFLLFQSAYSELYFTDALWPDFDAAELDKALAAYAARNRRFGRTEEQIIEEGNAHGG